MKRLFFILLLALFCADSFAYDFSSEGIYYTITSSTNSTVMVTYKSSFEKYTGNIVIPATVTYNSKTYSVTSIERDAFLSCTGLTSVEIPNSVTEIGRGAFCLCTGLTSITIPNSVTSIGESAFWLCSGLTDVVLEDGTGVLECSFGCLNCPVKNLHIGRNTSGFSMNGNTTLTNLTFGNSVTSIEEGAFSNCTGLTSITIPNSVTSIGGGAFSGCAGLTSVEIPNSVTAIGENAFDGCTGLTSVTIPNSVTSIGRFAFYSCTGLTDVVLEDGTGVLKCYSWGSWDSSCFSHCPVKTLHVGRNTSDFLMNGNTALTSLTFGNSVTSIEGYAFSGCTGLTSVTIPNSVTSIGSSAFSGCTGLTSIEIPNSVTSIRGGAFEGCSGLTTLFIPQSVGAAADGAFSGCGNLTDIYVNDRTPNTSVFNGSVFEGLDRSKCTLHVSPGRYQDYDFNAFCAGFTIREQPKTVCSQTENIIVVYSEKPQRWERSGNGGATWETIDYTGSFYTAPPISGTFLYRALNGNGTYSETVEVTDVILSGVTTLPAANTKTTDESVTFTLDAANANYSYQWYKDGVKITGATDSSYSISVLKVTDAGGYHCEVGNACGMALSTIASLTVNKAPQAIAFDELPVKMYGDGAFDLPETTDKGLTAVYQSSNTDVAVVSGNTIAIKGAGGVDIVATQPGNENYLPLAPVTRRLTVKKAPLTITAKDMERRSGEENPDFILLYDGFRHMDAARDLDLLPTVVCAAGIQSPKSSYDIVLQGGYDRNYEYTLRNGTLLVTGGVAVDDAKADGVTVYPNPVSEYFYIDGIEADTPVTVSDVSGKVVLQGVVTPGEAMSVAHLPQDVYIVRVAGKTVKMVKL